MFLAFEEQINRPFCLENALNLTHEIFMTIKREILANRLILAIFII